MAEKRNTPEEAAKKYARQHYGENYERTIRGGLLLVCKDAFIAGAKWQAEHAEDYPMPEDTVLFQKGVEEGKRLMLEDAVEGYVNYYEDGGGKLMAEAQVGCPYHMGDKVKIIIVKEE